MDKTSRVNSTLYSPTIFAFSFWFQNFETVALHSLPTREVTIYYDIFNYKPIFVAYNEE